MNQRFLTQSEIEKIDSMTAFESLELFVQVPGLSPGDRFVSTEYWLEFLEFMHARFRHKHGFLEVISAVSINSLKHSTKITVKLYP